MISRGAVTSPRRWPLALAAIVAAAILPAAQARADGAPRDLTLRLSDLAPGYLVGDDSGCGLGLTGEGAPRALLRLERHRHRGCSMEFERLWAPPGEPSGPPLVESAAFRFSREPGAVAGFGSAQALVAHVLGVRHGSLGPLSLQVSIGDAVAAFRTNDALVEGRPRRPGVALLWRAGRVLSLVFAGGRGGADGEQAAVRLALLQHARIRSPSPLRPGDNDDREVPLDNPRLGIEVHWLGRRFQPAGRLPALVLADSFGPLGPGEGPGWLAELDYEARGRGAGVKLGLWRPSDFARFERSRLGRLVRAHRCARSEQLALPAGRAVIYAGYSDPPTRCRVRAPDRYLAHVFLDGLVVSVNVPICFLCVNDDPDHPDPYDTLAGMRAVVKGLQPRPLSRRAHAPAPADRPR
jgi:hypothetical protein